MCNAMRNIPGTNTTA